MGSLYLVATPIGNLEDITLRALRLLREVSLIAAEDTRVSGRLLSHYEIETKMVSFHDFSSADKIEFLIDQLQTVDVALITDAGMPGLSDPGYRLVGAALAAGVTVTPIPGPTAVVTALVASGLPSDQFLYLGFLPRQKGARQAALRAVATLPFTLVFYESPHRLRALLADAGASLGDRPVVIARELTKRFEEFWRGSLSEAAVAMAERERIRGEITVVIGGAAADAGRWTEAAVGEALAAEMALGTARKAAAAKVAQMAGWRKRAVYDLSLNMPDL